MKIRLPLYAVAVLLLVIPVTYARPLSPDSSKKTGDDRQTVMTSDFLEYNAASKKYRAWGSVTITRDDAVIKSDEILYNEESAEAVATGNVTYADPETEIAAERAEYNMEKKSGRLDNAFFLQKKNNYRLTGSSIEKKGEHYYFSPEASFTTCDGPLPVWCFKGKQINAVMGDTLTAKSSTFRIFDQPVFYTPYLMATLNAERHSGFLLPVPGFSSSRGAGISLPYYQVISESMDATLVLDAFSRRGIGTGLEYRFAGPGGIKDAWWAYHIRDAHLKRHYFELRGLHDDREKSVGANFVNINFVNRKDFYQEFQSRRELRTQRFLESTADISAPVGPARLYLDAQYRVDLLQDTAAAPQKLPEAGLVMNYTRVGDFMATVSANAAYLYRKDGISAARFDLYPRVLHQTGGDVTLTQTAGVRETSYTFDKREGVEAKKNLQRTAFEYEAEARTRLFREYGRFTHIVEPSLRYRFVDASGNPRTVFDLTELYGRTSTIELSVLNRGITNGAETLDVRLSQGIDTSLGSRPFLPLRLEAGIKTPIALFLDTTYDHYSHKIETARSNIGFSVSGVNLSFGQQFSRNNEISIISAGAAFNPAKNINLSGSFWYDYKGAGLRDVSVAVRYTGQCWGLRFETIKHPGDYSFKVMIELAGVTSHQPPKLSGQ